MTGISAYGNYAYGYYNYNNGALGNSSGSQGYSLSGNISDEKLNGEANTAAGALTKTDGNESAGKTGAVKNPGESTEVAPGRKSSPAECETCKERKYQDGSDEMVSFKSAAHVSPEAAGAAVRSHEQEHVVNAYNKAEQDNGEVVQASVAIHTAVCPECGRTYVSGGTTTTQIKYNNESNPYQQERKAADAVSLVGANLDIAG